jgi:hypothetical protein
MVRACQTLTGKAMSKMCLSHGAINERKARISNSTEQNLTSKVFKPFDETQRIYTTKNYIFWDITPYMPFKDDGRFGGIFRLHLQGRKISQVINQGESANKQSLLATCYIGSFTTDYTALYPRSYKCS